MMFCKQCGQQIPDNAAFCPNCGTRTTELTPQNNGGAYYPAGGQAGYYPPGGQAGYYPPAGATQTNTATYAPQANTATYMPPAPYIPVISKSDYFSQNPSAAHTKREKIGRILYIVSIACMLLCSLLNILYFYTFTDVGYFEYLFYMICDLDLLFLIPEIISGVSLVGALLFGYIGRKNYNTGMLVGFVICSFIFGLFSFGMPQNLFFSIIHLIKALPLLSFSRIIFTLVPQVVVIVATAMSIVVTVLTAQSNKEFRQYCMAEAMKYRQ